MKKTLSLISAVIILLSVLLTPIKAQAAEVLFAVSVNTQSGNLNVRSAPSLSASVIARAPKDSMLTVIGDSASFCKVQYAKDSYGYVSKAYVKHVSSEKATVNVSYGNLNVRHGAGTANGVKDRLANGTELIILSTHGDWLRILYHGSKTGYVSAAYVKRAADSHGKISLSVPSFKQTDGRWASVTIGTSGKTIGKIGCATTAISMMESYRKGYNIYPHNMAKMLSYSSSGNVYWPSDYKVTVSSESYLEKFYELLSEGKPVLFGSKNHYGSQHWIVVTGFKGGELKAENFTINDPGSSSRVLLSQFIGAYPVFYKYFTY